MTLRTIPNLNAIRGISPYISEALEAVQQNQTTLRSQVQATQAPTSTPAATPASSTPSSTVSTPSPAMAFFEDQILAAPVTLTGGSGAQLVDQMTVTMPTAPGIYRVRVNYSYYLHNGTNTVSYATDGTNIFGQCQVVTASANAELLGSQCSPQSYSAGQTVTFSIFAAPLGNCTVETTDNVISTVPSRMQIEVYSSAV